MGSRIGELIAGIRLLEEELEAEFARRQADLRFGIERGRIVFEQEVLRRHRELKTTLWRYMRKAQPLVLLSAPVIYSLIIPLVLLDVFVSFYQLICFPIYEIEKARRGDYIVFDRHHLAYLNVVEKFNCAYCSYANGLLAYVSEIASRTERYWCPIKHARRLAATHRRHREFADYGDAKGYKDIVEEIIQNHDSGKFASKDDV